VADLLVRLYENFSGHWGAGVVACLLSGAVASWFPMLFMIVDFEFYEQKEIGAAALLGWAGGTLAPLVFGFRNLGFSLTVLLILTTFITVSAMLKALKEAVRRLDEVEQ
jgi:hypothetical protein